MVLRLPCETCEIRGAGNLLGAEQHGHMEAVGYDLWDMTCTARCSMKLVREAKGNAMEGKVFDASVDMLGQMLTFRQLILQMNPKKLDIYKRIAGVETDNEAEEMLEELIDRFGEPPKSVQNLLTIARLKSLAHSAYIKEVIQKEDSLKLVM